MRLLRAFVFATVTMPAFTSVQAADEEIKIVPACPHTVETYKTMLLDGTVDSFSYHPAQCDDSAAKVMHSQDLCTVVACAVAGGKVVCDTKTVDPPEGWLCPFTSINSRKP